MSFFALQSREARADFIYQFAIPARIPAYIAEKDFWVCWLLGGFSKHRDWGSTAFLKGARRCRKCSKLSTASPKTLISASIQARSVGRKLISMRHHPRANGESAWSNWRPIAQ